MEHYEHLRVLGRGANGIAHLARRRSADGALHVIKEINLGQMQQPACCQAQNEAEVLKSLSHINIVAHVATFLEASRLFIIMEFADGGDLSTAIHKRKSVGGRFLEREAVGIFAQCCLGLQHAHAQHVLHRDLKSQNIFLTKTGHVKVGDFGIAVVLDHTSDKVKTGVGSPAYTAPEVCDDRPYGLKADVWSLGVVLYEVLALELPFQAPSLVTLVQRICQEQPSPLSESYSPEARDLVHKALRKQPQERPSLTELLRLPRLRSAQTELAPLPPERTKQALSPPSSSCGVPPRSPMGRSPTASQRSIGGTPQVSPTVAPAEAPAVAYDADFASFAEQMLSQTPAGRWGSSGNSILPMPSASGMVAALPKEPPAPRADPAEVVDEILDFLEQREAK